MLNWLYWTFSTRHLLPWKILFARENYCCASFQAPECLCIVLSHELRDQCVFVLVHVHRTCRGLLMSNHSSILTLRKDKSSIRQFNQGPDWHKWSSISCLSSRAALWTAAWFPVTSRIRLFDPGKSAQYGLMFNLSASLALQIEAEW